MTPQKQRKPLLYGPNGKPVSWGLYPTPRINGFHKNRIRFFGAASRDNKDSFTPYDWRELLDFSRQLFASFGDIAGAIYSKNNWAFGAEGWRAKYCGKNKDWGKQAEEWLETIMFPNACLRGEPYDFQTALFVAGVAIDVDGDQGMILTEDENHFPKVDFVPAHRINSAQIEDVVKTGWASGARILNGIIKNNDNKTIGYRVETSNAPLDKKYVDIPIRSMALYYDPVWVDQTRGIPRAGVCLLDSWDLQDVDKNIFSQVKSQTRIGLIRKSIDGESGSDDALFSPVVTPDGSSPTTGAPSGDPLEEKDYEHRAKIVDIADTDMWELSTENGEEIVPFEGHSPSPEVEAYVRRVTRRVLFSLGWAFELLDPSAISGSNTRLIIQLAKQSISTRQRTGMKMWLRGVRYFIAKGMKEGFLAENYDDDDAYKWYPELPAELSVDAGNDEQSDREGYKLGVTTLSSLAAKKGEDWQRIREQREREENDLIERAKRLSDFSGGKLSFLQALERLEQRTPNGLSTIQQQDDSDSQPHPQTTKKK